MRGPKMTKTLPTWPCPLCDASGERFTGVECEACDGDGEIVRGFYYDE